eukprot:UN28420
MKEVLALPSDYWLELSDLWFCTSEHAKNFIIPRHEILAREKTVFQGKTYIMLSAHDLNKKSYEYVYAASEKDMQWVGLKCTKCKLIFGKMEIDVRRPKLATDVELFKYRINTPDALFSLYTVVTHWVETMLTLLESKNKRQFWFIDHGQSRALHIKIITNDSYIWLKDYPKNKKTFPGMLPVIKVLYKEKKPDDDDSQRRVVHGG